MSCPTYRGLVPLPKWIMRLPRSKTAMKEEIREWLNARGVNGYSGAVSVERVIELIAEREKEKEQ